MAREDGSVIIKASVNVAQAEKDLGKLKSSIAKTESEIEEMTKKKSEAERASVFSAAELDAEKAKLAEMKAQLEEIKAVAKDTTLSPSSREEAKVRIPAQQQEIADQQTRVRILQAEYNKVDASVERYTRKLEETNRKLERQTDEAGQLAKEINSVSMASRKMADAQKKAEKSMSRFALRLREVIRSALIFTLITQTLAKFRDWIGKVIRTNAEATAAIAKLKGALLTLAQPLVEIIIPALTSLVNILAKVVSVAAQLVSYIFGKSAKQSAESAKALDKETKALESVDGAAKKAAGSLAGFDEINSIQTENIAGGAAGEIAPDFTIDTELSEDHLSRLLGLVKLIGSAFLGWKIGKALGLGLTQMLGLMTAIYGAVGFVASIFDAWANGVSWENLKGMIFGLTLAVVGLYAAFGPVAAGIAMVVGGLAMLVTGFKDAFQNGWNLQNLLTSVAGLFAAGLGISLLTGSFIPALIAGIAALLLAFTVAMGHGDELLAGLKETFQGFANFFKGVFTGDMELAAGGIAKIFRGLGEVIGSVVDSFRDLFNGFFDWLDEKTGGKLSGIIDFMRGLFGGLFDFVDGVLGDIVDAGTQMLQGLLEFVSGVFAGDWNKAWQGVKKIFSGVWNGIIGVLEGAVNLIIRGVNWLISQLNKIHFTVPEWVPGIGGKSVGINIPKVREISIPRLATGAVIPPNREFLAVLGDQRSGNNIEAPEDLIRQIVREEAGGMNTELLQAILEAIKAGHVMKVDKKVLARTAAQGINEMTIEAGKPVLIF